MSLKEMFKAGKPYPAQSQNALQNRELEDPDEGRCLRLLAEGTARAVPEIEGEFYGAFRARIDNLTPKMRDQLPGPDKLELVRSVLQLFEEYRNTADSTLRNRTSSWRALVTTLLRELLVSLNMGESSASAAPLIRGIARLTTAEEIDQYSKEMNEFLHPPKAASDGPLSSRSHPDGSTANDNVAGLLGGGRAVERLTSMMEQGQKGYAVLFRLNCLDVIGQRFGADAMQECVMAVSAYLVESLHGDDAVFHWSDCSLLALLQGRPSDQILHAELNRILLRNRDISVNIGDRKVMLRVPLQFNITPISQMRTPEDLYKISAQQGGLL